MKNIFQVGEITFDFNLTELLRGKFDAENITVADVLIGTERKTSGYIPIKQKREEKQKGKVILFIGCYSSAVMVVINYSIPFQFFPAPANYVPLHLL